MDMGIPFSGISWKRKYRWKLSITGFIGTENLSTGVLPPLKAARPSLAFKELAAEHLYETIYFPGKPEWETMEVTAYDLICNQNPIFNWLRRIYDPNGGNWLYAVNDENQAIDNTFILDAYLELLSGCGDTMECWKYENVWPQKIQWGELDMGSSDVVMVDLTLRYARAFWLDCAGQVG